MTVGAAQSLLKLTNSLSRRLNSTTVSSTITCLFGIGFMKDSNSLLSVAKIMRLTLACYHDRSATGVGHPVLTH